MEVNPGSSLCMNKLIVYGSKYPDELFYGIFIVT